MIFAEQTIQLPIRIGPKTAFVFRFQGSVCKTHFTKINKLPNTNDVQEVCVFPSVPSELRSSSLSVNSGKVLYSPRTFPHYLADLSTTFEDYLEKFGSKSKSTLKRKVKKFVEAAGTAEVLKIYKSQEELRAFHRVARELSKKTYQEKLIGSGLPENPEFIANMLTLADVDNVRAFTLHTKEKIAAYLYCSAHDGILFFDYLGYDPALSSLSPGTVLQYLAFEYLFGEQRFRTFDFEEGESQHKRQFSTSVFSCCPLMIFTLSPKALLYVFLDMLANSVNRAAFWIMDKTGTRTKLRQAIR